MCVKKVKFEILKKIQEQFVEKFNQQRLEVLKALQAKNFKQTQRTALRLQCTDAQFHFLSLFHSITFLPFHDVFSFSIRIIREFSIHTNECNENTHTHIDEIGCKNSKVKP